MNTFAQARQTIAATLHLCEEQITPQSSLKDDFNTDSLGLIEVVMALEETFGVTLGEETIEFTTVQQIVDYIERQQSGA